MTECETVFIQTMKVEKEWASFLKAQPNGTFYHSLEWKEVIRRTFHYDPLYLEIRNDLGRIVGVCPGFIVNSMHVKIYDSTPYSDYGGPIIEQNWAERGSLLLRDFLQEFCPSKGIMYAKLCFVEESGLSKYFQPPPGCNERTKGVMEVDLRGTPSDFLWNKMLSGNLKRKIKRIEHYGFEAHEARTRSDLIEFYNLYNSNMKHIGVSPDPYKFIESMWNTLYPDNLRIWLLRKDRAVAAELFLLDGQGSYGHLAAVDRKRVVREAINYLHWVEIKAAEQEGKRCVSLGSTPSDPCHPYHIQKKRLGSSFHPQEMIWYPLSSVGYALLQARTRTASAWRTMRRFLPVGLKSFLERRLSEF